MTASFRLHEAAPREGQPHGMTPGVILCADDFALSPAISAAIAALAASGSINAASCMVPFENWADDWRILREALLTRAPAHGRFEVGLHLTLSGERPITHPITLTACMDADGRLPGADRVMMMAYRRQLPLDAFRAEIDAQFAAFRAVTGRAPDFVDAHQHVHVHPGLRNVIVDAVLRHAPQAWVRNPSDTLSAMIRRPFPAKALGSSLHALGFARLLAAAGIRTNGSFAGHYDFASDYAALLPRFFKARSALHVVMCHPGAGATPGDTIAAARTREAAVLGQVPLADRLRAVRARGRGTAPVEVPAG